MVIDPTRAEIDLRRHEFGNHGAQRISFGEPRDLVAELKRGEDVLHVRGEPVEIRLKVRFQLLLTCARLQISEGELRRVVERLARRLPECRLLVHDLLRIQGGLHVDDGLLGRLKY